MLVLAGAVRMSPEAIARLRPHMDAMLSATRAEPGCIAYAFAVDVLEPGVMRIFEVFADEAALELHFATPHMAAYRKAVAEVGFESRDMSRYTITNTVKL